MIHPLIDKSKVDVTAKNEVALETAPPVSVEEKPAYTKTAINRMSTSELQKLGKSLGFKDAKGMSGSELKKKLIEHFGL